MIETQIVVRCGGCDGVMLWPADRVPCAVAPCPTCSRIALAPYVSTATPNFATPLLVPPLLPKTLVTPRFAPHEDVPAANYPVNVFLPLTIESMNAYFVDGNIYFAEAKVISTMGRQPMP